MRKTATLTQTSEIEILHLIEDGLRIDTARRTLELALRDNRGNSRVTDPLLDAYNALKG